MDRTSITHRTRREHQGSCSSLLLDPTAIDSNIGGVTVNVVEPLTDTIVAMMEALPWITPLAKPVTLIVAAGASLEVHHDVPLPHLRMPPNSR